MPPVRPGYIVRKALCAREHNRSRNPGDQTDLDDAYGPNANVNDEQLNLNRSNEHANPNDGFRVVMRHSPPKQEHPVTGCLVLYSLSLILMKLLVRLSYANF